ncbi:MAG: hypothetical protein NUK65_11890, partial [Firmicutes bacterium]|nr:hypothetical protein [Bacillota bacterium]
MRGKKVIAVVSPVAAGKTFIAVNLAATAARYNDTALLDLDFKERAVHTWMNLPAGYRALDMLVSGESTEPITVSGIKVYTNDLSA